jgi:hypothetical protein
VFQLKESLNFGKKCLPFIYFLSFSSSLHAFSYAIYAFLIYARKPFIYARRNTENIVINPAAYQKSLPPMEDTFASL